MTIGKRSNGTRGTNISSASKSRKASGGGEASPMQVGPYNDVQKLIDNIGEVDEEEVAVGKLSDAAPRYDRNLYDAMNAISSYVEDANFTTAKQGAMLESIAKQSPRTFYTLYRGIRIEDNAAYKKFMDSIKKVKRYL